LLAPVVIGGVLSEDPDETREYFNDTVENRKSTIMYVWRKSFMNDKGSIQQRSAHYSSIMSLIKSSRAYSSADLRTYQGKITGTSNTCAATSVLISVKHSITHEFEKEGDTENPISEQDILIGHPISNDDIKDIIDNTSPEIANQIRGSSEELNMSEFDVWRYLVHDVGAFSHLHAPSTIAGNILLEKYIKQIETLFGRGNGNRGACEFDFCFV